MTNGIMLVLSIILIIFAIIPQEQLVVVGEQHHHQREQQQEAELNKPSNGLNMTAIAELSDEELSKTQLRLVSKSTAPKFTDGSPSVRWFCQGTTAGTRRRKNQCRLVMESKYTPVIMWHGMGDTAFGSINADRKALEAHFEGIQVFSIQIGNNPIEDELGGYFVNVNKQIDQACTAILNNKYIQAHGSFNAIGFSQGGQFMRGLIERCPFKKHSIRVKNFISLGGQHQGVYGLPRCLDKTFCDYIRYVLTTAAYEKNVQAHVVQAEYWHDPLNEESYKRENIFLADINNELNINETYRENLLQLDNMVLVEFLQDDMVVPPISSTFGFFKQNSKTELEPLESSQIYLDDRIGLRQLAESQRLHSIRVPGRHLQYHISWFLDEIASKYLNN